jgi:hypothetical protein
VKVPRVGNLSLPLGNWGNFSVENEVNKPLERGPRDIVLGVLFHEPQSQFAPVCDVMEAPAGRIVGYRRCQEAFLQARVCNKPFGPKYLALRISLPIHDGGYVHKSASSLIKAKAPNGSVLVTTSGGPESHAGQRVR